MNRRWAIIAAIILLVVGVTGGVFFARLSQLEREAETASMSQTDLETRVAALYAQLEAEGIQPVVPPVATNSVPVVIVQAGDDGRDGRDGKDGQDAPVAPGQDGVDGTDGTDGATGDTGTQGAPGANGVDGTNGADGADGATGPQGEIGPQGAQGPQGFPGFDGSAPQGWTFSWLGIDWVCTDPNSDLHYECDPSPHRAPA